MEEVIDIFSEDKIVNNDNYFEVIDTGEKAYWLGIMVSDGHLPTDSKTAVNLKWTARARYKEEHVEHISKFASLFNTKIKFVLEKYRYKTGEDKGERALMLYICFCNYKVRQDLINLGILPQKTKKDITPVIKNVPKHLLHHFIRGVFDGDGNVDICEGYDENPYPRIPTIEITCNSKEFLEEIKSIVCSMTGASDAFSVIKSKDSFVLRWRCEKSIIKIREWLYRDSTLHLNRKRKKMDKIRIIIEPRPTCKYLGVKWDRRVGKWRASIYFVPGKVKSLGSFADAEYGALVREKVLIEHNLVRSKRNFPELSLEEIQDRLRNL